MSDKRWNRLKTELKDISSDRMIKVGCKNGSGFVFCGTVADFLSNTYALEQTRKVYAMSVKEAAQKRLQRALTRQEYTNALYDTMTSDQKAFAAVRDAIVRLDLANKMLTAEPYEDRRVKKVYPSVTPGHSDCLIFLIEGQENGEDDNDIHMAPLTSENIDLNGAVKLYGAIWREPSDHIANYYLEILKNAKDVDAIGIDEVLKNAKPHEEEQEVTEAVVKVCKTLAKREYKKWLEENDD